MCLVGENDGMHLTDFLLSCIQLRQPTDCVHFKTFQKTCFCKWGFQREELGQLCRKLSDCLIHVSAEQGGLLCVNGRPTRVKASSFFFFLTPSRALETCRDTRAPASAALLAEGEKLPQISHGWLAAGRPTEPMECMRLSNVTSVDLVARPRRRATINLSHRR